MVGIPFPVLNVKNSNYYIKKQCIIIIYIKIKQIDTGKNVRVNFFPITEPYLLAVRVFTEKQRKENIIEKIIQYFLR